MEGRPHKRYEFGPFQLDSAERSLLLAGKPVPLTPKVFDLLQVLVSNRGHLVKKDDLLEEVWGGSFIEEGNLNRNISILRKALGEDSSARSYIETVPKYGYRFVAPVREVGIDDSRATESDAVADSRMGPLERHTDSDPATQRAPSLSDELSRDRTAPDESLAGNAEEVSEQVASPPGRSLPSRQWKMLGGLAAVVLGVLMYALSDWRAPHGIRPELTSLAVLPLENLSGDPQEDFFVDGMTDALISSLAQVRALKVISRRSVMRFKESRRPLPDIARELGADAVVEGSVQRVGGRVKIAAKLIHGPSDTTLWAREYDRDLTDVLKLQGEVARAIVDEIRIQITADERARLSSARRLNPAAHEAYLLGRYHVSRYNEEDLKRAIDYFEQAIRIEPNDAVAYAELSSAWKMRGTWGAVRFKESEWPARSAAQRALALDSRLAAAHVAMGHVKYVYDWDWVGAERDLRRSLEMDANNVDGHFYYAILLQALGRFPEAISHIRRAQQLDPLSAGIESNFGRILYRARRYEEAIPHLMRAIELDPRAYGAFGRLGDVHEQMGRYEEAVGFHEKARQHGGGSAYLTRIARVHARIGNRMEARRILERLAATDPDAVAGIDGASAFAALGDRDEAFRLLMKVVEERTRLAIFIKEDPPFDSLQADPRWRTLLSRMNFPPE